MAYVISEECISCGACQAECPVEAISEGDGKFVIDADKCAECGACVDVCPVGAPQQEQFLSVGTSLKQGSKTGVLTEKLTSLFYYGKVTWGRKRQKFM